MTEKAILCLGDSLTWGSVPAERDGPTGRYPRKARWTGVMVDRLGEDYVVIEEGLSARTTNIDDPADPRLNGAAYLPATLASHLPLDLVIIMLGTNDTKAYFSRTPLDIAAGMSVLAGQVLSATSGVGCAFLRPQVLLVAPPQLRPMP
jgi:lysophospholipase L1-like esterase